MASRDNRGAELGTPSVALRLQWRRTIVAFTAIVLGLTGVAIVVVLVLGRTWRDAANAGVASRAAKLDDAETVTAAAVAAVLVVAVAGAGAVLLVGRRWADRTIDPIEHLSRTLRRFGDGDFSERVRLRRRDELGEIAQRFNAMADLVAASHHDVAFEVYHDALTGLVNGPGIIRRLDVAVDHVPPGIGGPHILVIGLDDFDAINDRLGSADGEEVLRIVGNRLLACTRPSDVAARLEDEVFAIVLDSPSDTDVARQVAERVLQALRQPLRIAGHDVEVAASIGIAGYSSTTADAHELLRHALAAMKAAHADSTKGWELYAAHHDQLLPPSNS